MFLVSIVAHLYIKVDKFDRSRRIDVARKTIVVSLHFSENIMWKKCYLPLRQLLSIGDLLGFKMGSIQELSVGSQANICDYLHDRHEIFKNEYQFDTIIIIRY